MQDIVVRIRNCHDAIPRPLAYEAADVIEQLRAAAVKRQDDYERVSAKWRAEINGGIKENVRLREELSAQSELIQHEWASPYELAGLKSEIERLRLFVWEQLCECYDEYSKRRPSPCERCQILYGHETWVQFENAAEQSSQGEGE